MKTTTQKSGQAMIEMTVGLITIMILVAGIIQFVTLSQTYCTMDATIRSNAGVVAMSSPTFFDTPQDICNWQVGPDGQHMTADDTVQPNSSMIYGPKIAIYTVPDGNTSDWDIFTQLPHPSSLENLYQNQNSLTALGFVGIQYSQQVPVLDVLQELVYNSANVQVQESCWLPAMGGLY